MRYFITAIFICAFCFACKKEYSDIFFEDPNNLGNDTTWKTSVAANAPINLLSKELQDEPQVDSFDVAAGATLQFEDHLEITFPASACTGASSGMVKVEVIFLREKGDFVRYERPTTSNTYLLETGGSLHLRVSQNQTPLQLAPGKAIIIKYRDEQPIQKMKVFYGDTTANNPGNFDWIRASSNSDSIYVWQDSGAVKGYEMLSERFGWINCDYFIDSAVEKTTISTLLPLNYTNSNTAVYAVFKNQRIIVRLYPDVEHRLFSAPNIPIGSNIAVISFSKIGEEYYLGTKDVIVSVHDAIEMTPYKNSLEQVSDYLDSL